MGAHKISRSAMARIRKAYAYCKNCKCVHMKITPCSEIAK